MQLMHVYQTDFCTFRLAPAFVAEANARWPDRRFKRQPKWALKVHRAITALAHDIYIGARKPVATIRTLKTLDPYIKAYG